MPWNQQGGGWQGPGGSSGGPWGSGGDNGGGPPWGRGSGGSGGGGQPPDLEDLIRRMRDRGRRITPGGFRGGRLVVAVAVALVLIWGAWDAFYRVQPGEVGLPLVFGRWTGERTLPGPHFRWPSPIGSVVIVDVQERRRTEVGYVGETGRSSIARDVPVEALMLTGDQNIIDIQSTVFWDIKDAAGYAFQVRDPDEAVKDVAESAMRQVIGNTPLATALAEGRGRVEQDTAPLMQETLDVYGSGINIIEVQMQSVDPPDAVIDAFRDVQAARADQERLINEAQAYQNSVVPVARGEAQKMIQEAEAYREQVINVALGDAARFLSVYDEYVQAKDVTARRLYLETMENVLQDMDKLIIDPSAMGETGVVPYLPLDRLRRRDGGDQEEER